MVGRGLVAGFAGTVVMTAFQKLVEMPLTGREDSYAPSDFAQRILSLHLTSARGQKRLNYVTHFTLGSMWGAVSALSTAAGLRGQKRVHVVFAFAYIGDVVLEAVTGGGVVR